MVQLEMQSPSRGGPFEWHSENGNAVSTAFRLRHLGTGLYLAAVPGTSSAPVRRTSVSTTFTVGAGGGASAGASTATTLVPHTSPARATAPGVGLASAGSVVPLGHASAGRVQSDGDKAFPATPLPAPAAIASVSSSSPSASGTGVSGEKEKETSKDKGQKEEKDTVGEPSSASRSALANRRSVSPSRSAAYLASAAILRTGGSLLPKARILEQATVEKSPKTRGDEEGERDVSPVRSSESFADAAARKVLKRPVPGGALNINPASAGVLVGVRPKAAASEPVAAPGSASAATAPATPAAPVAALSAPGTGPRVDTAFTLASPPPPPPLSPKKKVR
jgi:hypothetical protein